MTEGEARQILSMIEGQWGSVGAVTPLWLGFLRREDATLTTKAVAYFAERNRGRPQLADLREIIVMLGEKSGRQLPPGVCPDCGDDRFVLVALRAPTESDWTRRQGKKARGTIEEYAPCPSCNAAADAGFRRYDGSEFVPLDAARTRERMQRAAPRSQARSGDVPGWVHCWRWARQVCAPADLRPFPQQAGHAYGESMGEEDFERLIQEWRTAGSPKTASPVL